MHDEQPANDQDVPVNEVPVERGQGLAFRLGSSVEPLVTRLLIYRSGSAAGIPSREDAEEVNCFGPPICQVDTSNDEGRTTDVVYTGPDEDITWVVLYVEYATSAPQDIDENVASYRVGWVVRLDR